MNRAEKIFAVAGFLISWFLFLPVALFAAESRSNSQEWEKTVRAAEQEGQVVVYIAGYEAVIEAGVFQKAYPKIKVVTVTGSGTQLAPRIASERRAEKYLADVYNGGGSSLYQILHLGKMLQPIKPALVLPEVADESRWWEGRHKYVDPEGMYIFVYEGDVASGGGGSYNTNLLNPKDYKSYWDLLTPKLKGKIVAMDLRQVRGTSAPWQYLYYHAPLGPSYIKRLYGEMEVIMSADLRQAVDWMATGKVVICLPCQSSAVAKANNQGLPVDMFEPYQFKEGVSISSAFGQLALMNPAPHPNAAKVFVNWLLSREGQATFQKVMSQPGDPRDSRRVDVPKDHVPLSERRRDGMKYFDIDDLNNKDIRPITKLLDEILAGKK
ncbi:MAG TPA: extracellular solute-binding protein [Candidatus Binatia bacterium]